MVKQASRRRYRCGVCGEAGHNRKSCGVNNIKSCAPAFPQNTTSKVTAVGGHPNVPTVGTVFSAIYDKTEERDEEEQDMLECDSGTVWNTDTLLSWCELATGGFHTCEESSAQDAENVACIMWQVSREGNVVSSKVAAELVSHFSPQLRVLLAQCGNVPKVFSAVLAKDVNASVRRALARNKHTHADVLDVLAGDHLLAVRECVLFNLNTRETTRHSIL